MNEIVEQAKAQMMMIEQIYGLKIIGAGQFGSKSPDYRRQFFDIPDNMTRLFVHSVNLGVKA